MDLYRAFDRYTQQWIYTHAYSVKQARIRLITRALKAIGRFEFIRFQRVDKNNQILNEYNFESSYELKDR